ncbi:hypothetical protein H0H93_010659, partial [Arthromyces matolae]
SSLQDQGPGAAEHAIDAHPQITIPTKLLTKMGFPPGELVNLYVPLPQEQGAKYQALLKVMDTIRQSGSLKPDDYRPFVNKLKNSFELDIPPRKQTDPKITSQSELIVYLKGAISENNDLYLRSSSKSPNEPLKPGSISEARQEHIYHANFVTSEGTGPWKPIGTIVLPRDLFKHMTPRLERDISIDIPPPGHDHALASFKTVLKVLRGCQDYPEVVHHFDGPNIPTVLPRTNENTFEMSLTEEKSMLLEAVDCHNSHGQKTMVLPRRIAIPDSMLKKIHFTRDDSEPVFLYIPYPVTFHYVEDRDHISQLPGHAEYAAFMNVIQIMRASKVLTSSEDMQRWIARIKKSFKLDILTKKRGSILVIAEQDLVGRLKAAILESNTVLMASGPGAEFASPRLNPSSISQATTSQPSGPLRAADSSSGSENNKLLMASGSGVESSSAPLKPSYAPQVATTSQSTGSGGDPPPYGNKRKREKSSSPEAQVEGPLFEPFYVDPGQYSLSTQLYKSPTYLEM